MKKTIKKNTKKAPKMDLILNCTNCETGYDVNNEYINAKVRAGRPITTAELETIENRNPQFEVIAFCECMPMKKLPWYKRFWNWLCRK